MRLTTDFTLALQRYLQRDHPLMRFLRHYIWVPFIIALTAVAVLSVLTRGALYYAESHPEQVRQWLSQGLGQRVDVVEMEARLHFLSPYLELRGIKLYQAGSEEPLFAFDAARIELDSVASLLARAPVLSELTLSGIRSEVRRDKNHQLHLGRWTLSRATAQTDESSSNKNRGFRWLLNQGAISISDSRFTFIDESKDYPPITFNQLNLTLKNAGDRHQLDGQFYINGSQANATFHLDFFGDVGSFSEWRGKSYLKLEKITQALVLEHLSLEKWQIDQLQILDSRGDVELWSELRYGEFVDLKGILSLKDVQLKHLGHQQSLTVNNLDSHFRAYQEDNYWQADLFSIEIVTEQQSWDINRLQAGLTQDDERYQVDLYLDRLALHPLTALARLILPPSHQAIKVLNGTTPAGELADFFAKVSLGRGEKLSVEHFEVQAKARDLSIQAWQKLPQFSGVSGWLYANQNRGHFTLNSSNVQTHIVRLFREPWQLNNLKGVVHWQKDNDGWYVQVDQLKARNDDLSVSDGFLALWLRQQGQPFMQIEATFKEGQASSTSRYLPVAIMKDKLVNWLDRGIVAGQVSEGAIAYHGPLKGFPYRQQQGHMDIVFNAEDVVLDYLKGWPTLSDVKAQAHFSETGMRIRGDSAQVYGARATNIAVDIERFKAATLTIRGDIKSSAEDAMKYLTNAGLLPKQSMSKLKVAGESDVALSINVPLRTPKQTQVHADVALRKGSLKINGLDEPIADIQGKLVIDKHHIRSQQLTARWLKQPFTLALNSSQEGDSLWHTHVLTQGRFSLNDAPVKRLLPTLTHPWLKKLDGAFDWQLDVDIPHRQGVPTLTLQSDLNGMRIDLPEPLAKPAQQPSSLTLRLSPWTEQGFSLYAGYIGPSQQPVALELGFLSQAPNWSMDRVNLHFGDLNASLPGASVIRLSGNIQRLDLSPWLALFPEQNKVTRSAEQGLPLELALARVSLKLPERQDNQPEPDALANSFPVVNGRIQSLTLNQYEIGAVSVQSKAAPDGVVVQHLKVKNPEATLSASGKWQRLPQSASRFKATLYSKEAGKLLRHFGFNSDLKQAETDLQGNLLWPGTPLDFDVEKVQGTVTVDIGEGRIKELNPGGLGRLIGLVNIGQLERRLSLDFSDVIRSGYTFDKIDGTMVLKDGVIYSDDVSVVSPSSQVVIQGQTDFINRQYNQYVTVLPKLSGSLTVAGAIAGGPIGGAAAWVAGELLGDKIDKVTQYHYTIKGSWDDPQIQRVPTKLQKNLGELAEPFNVDNIRKYTGFDYLFGGERQQQEPAK